MASLRYPCDLGYRSLRNCKSTVDISSKAVWIFLSFFVFQNKSQVVSFGMFQSIRFFSVILKFAKTLKFSCIEALHDGLAPGLFMLYTCLCFTCLNNIIDLQWDTYLRNLHVSFCMLTQGCWSSTGCIPVMAKPLSCSFLNLRALQHAMQRLCSILKHWVYLLWHACTIWSMLAIVFKKICQEGHDHIQMARSLSRKFPVTFCSTICNLFTFEYILLTFAWIKLSVAMALSFNAILILFWQKFNFCFTFRIDLLNSICQKTSSVPVCGEPGGKWNYLKLSRQFDFEIRDFKPLKLESIPIMNDFRQGAFCSEKEYKLHLHVYQIRVMS